MLDVHCYRQWPKRGRKSAPTWLAGYFFDWMKTSAGEIDATKARFAEVIDPLIEELHQTTPKGQPLDRKAVTGLIYDRLSAGGIEVRIRPPLRGHSIRGGPGS